jgi:ankyrin repeat protein
MNESDYLKGSNALHTACEENHRDWISLLLSAGAQLDALDDVSLSLSIIGSSLNYL